MEPAWQDKGERCTKHATGWALLNGGWHVVRRAVGALLKAATRRQLGVAVFFLVCASMLLLDWTVGEQTKPAASTPTAATRPASQPTAGPSGNPTDAEKQAVPEGESGTGPDQEPPAEPVAAAPRDPLRSLLSGPTFVRFLGFSMLSMGVAVGVLFVFWRLAREDP
jgi:hypothetical protein